MAIWEAVLDATNDEGTWTPGGDLGNGTFDLTYALGYVDTWGLTDEQEALVNDMLAAVAAADLGAFSTEGYMLAYSACNQDFVIKTVVPIPSALLLLGSGLIGFIGLRRKRQGGK